MQYQVNDTPSKRICSPNPEPSTPETQVPKVRLKIKSVFDIAFLEQYGKPTIMSILMGVRETYASSIRSTKVYGGRNIRCWKFSKQRLHALQVHQGWVGLSYSHCSGYRSCVEWFCQYYFFVGMDSCKLTCSGGCLHCFILSTPVADDLDNDGKMEIVVATLSGYVYCFETTSAYHPLKAWPSRVPLQCAHVPCALDVHIKSMIYSCTLWEWGQL